jgi:23S rRNA (pseudouridine1915-N3)-methyltransferase
MQIKIIAVGKKMPAWVTDAYQEYAKRFPNNFNVILQEINTEKRHKNSVIESLINKEGGEILAHIAADDIVIALDEHGKEWTSVALSEKLQSWHDLNQSAVFLIGGPDGLADACKKRANFIWSLSQLTLPHPIVRIVLIEQLYRAVTILQGHPYHRE